MSTVSVTLLVSLGVFAYDTLLLRFPDGVFPSGDVYALLRDTVPTHDGLKGWLDNAFVLVDTAGTAVSVSLPGFLYGSNAYALPLSEVRDVFECICLRLGIDPLELAATRVFRLDAGVNLSLRHRVAAYVGLCVEVQRTARLPFDTTGLVFKNTLRETAIYDKSRQLLAKGIGVPAEWTERDLNVGRFEVRFTRQLAREFGRPVYAPDLWDAGFFRGVVARCVERFGQIRLARDLGVPVLTSTRRFWDTAALHGIRHAYGESRTLALINDAREAGQISGMQASRLRKKIRDAAANLAYTTESNLAGELTAAIESAKLHTLASL